MRRVVVACGLGLAGLSAGVQSFGLQGPPQVFRSRVDHVTLDVVVTDGSDRPVRGLTADDFEVYESHRPQAISDFHFVSIPPSGGGEPREAPQVSDVGTNGPRAQDSRLFVVVVDDLHLVESSIDATQKLLGDFVRRLAPDDEAAILFVGHSNLSQNFTNDPDRLSKAVASVRAAIGFGIGITGRVQLEELPYGRAAIWQLANVVRALADSTHARRAVVYVGTLSQLDPSAPIGTPERSEYDMLQQYTNDLWALAARSDVPIYTVDPRGVASLANAASMSQPHFEGANVNDRTLGDVAANRGQVASSSEFGRPTDDRATPQQLIHRIQVQQDHLVEMAVNTGGMAFINQSNLDSAVDQIFTDNGSVYEIGYYPDPAVQDGQWHPVEVRVNRPGLRVRSKRGYMAAGPPIPTSLRQSLDASLSAGLNVSGLVLRAEAVPLKESKSAISTLLTVGLTYPAGSTGGPQTDDVGFKALALDPEGKVLATVDHALHVDVPPHSEADAEAVLNEVIVLPSGVHSVRVALSSQSLDRVGMIQLPVDLPKLGDSRLHVSGLVIGVAGAATRPEGGLDALVPFQPTLDRSFSRDERVLLFGRLHWRSKDRSAHVSLTVPGSAGVPEDVVVDGTPGESGHTDGQFLFTLPLRGLAAGTHRADVTASLSNGQTVRRSLAFLVR